MRIVAAALKACLGIVVMSWTTAGLAASVTTDAAGTASGVGTVHAPGGSPNKRPSIRLQSPQAGLAGTCGGSAFDVNTFINVDTFASADVKVTAPGVGLIEEFTDETGANLGPYSAAYPTFHILAFGGGLAPNTPITITITAYPGPSLSGKRTSRSSIVFNCTTGAILHTRRRSHRFTDHVGSAALLALPMRSHYAAAASHRGHDGARSA